MALRAVLLVWVALAAGEAVIVGVTAPAAAQPAGAGNKISSIRIEGSVRAELDTVRSYLRLKEGDPFDPVEADRALKALYATGLFADVTIEMQGTTLVVKVVENPTINRIAFEGNRKIEDDKLRDEIQSKPRTALTRARVQADVERLLAIYRRGGRYNATIEAKTIRLDQNRVDLVFEISEGDVTGVKRISFVGNEAFSDGTLRSNIRTEESAWWRFLSSDDRFDPDRLNFDREMLRKFYLSKGYMDFSVQSAVAELAPSRDGFFVTFTLREGERYKVGKIDIVTRIEGVDIDALRRLVTISEGEWYDANQVEKTVAALSDAVGNMGFAFVEVRPNIIRNREQHIADVTFDIQQGPRTYIDRIDISGNTRTLDKVIRREFRVAEGDAFSVAKVRRSEQRVRNLGFFEKVDISAQPGSTPDKVNLNVAVTEKSTGDISFGAGFSTSSGPLGSISLGESNLLGRGQNLRLSFSLGTQSNSIDLSFTDPYFHDLPLRAGFDLFDTTQNKQSSTSYASSSVGFSLRMGWDFTEHTSQTVRYTLKQTDIYDIDSSASTAIQEQAGASVTSEVSETIAWDTRDQRLSPTKGWLLRNTIAVAGLGGDNYYVRATADGSIYQQIVDGFVASLSGSAGAVMPFNGTTLRLNNRFYIGGDSLPGWATSGIGPRDSSTGDSLGGKYFYTGMGELSFPLGLPKEFGLVGKAFVDVGSLWGAVQENGISILESSSMRIGSGIGIQWLSPFGPVRLDYTFPLAQEAYDKTQTVRISFGAKF